METAQIFRTPTDEYYSCDGRGHCYALSVIQDHWPSWAYAQRIEALPDTAEEVTDVVTLRERGHLAHRLADMDCTVGEYVSADMLRAGWYFHLDRPAGFAGTPVFAKGDEARDLPADRYVGPFSTEEKALARLRSWRDQFSRC